jgi:hypothetical protein
MFTQLSLFDSAVASDTTASFVPVSPAARPAAAPRRSVASPNRSTSCSAAEQRRVDEVRPMGELAQLVLARYDLLISRRQQRDRQRREQPRKSIRVLS